MLKFSRIPVCAALAAYLYVFSEWVFFYTKPSFLENIPFSQNLSILMIVPLFILAFCALPLAALWLLNTALKPAAHILQWIALFIPAFLAGVTVFLLVENFTYTVFKFNVGSFQGFGRYVYAIFFVCLIGLLCRSIGRWIQSPFWERHARIISLATAALLCVSVVLAVFGGAPLREMTMTGSEKSGKSLPNILILSTDGLNATHMSAYGYSRDTTPFIREFASESLVFENFFTNCANSAGSIGALLTGKLPTTTRVTFPPDVFKGIDSYEHLPGILKRLGYHNAEISLRHYTDPYDLNMRDAFDIANGRSVGTLVGLIRLPNSIQQSFSTETYFLEQILERISERLAHAFGVRDMINPYLVVTQMQGAKRKFPDSERVNQIFDFIRSSQGPFFIHVHFMGTHGSKFEPISRVFSVNETQDKHWMRDFFDDTVVDYDKCVRDVVQRLKQTGRFDNTVIILTTDHGMGWSTYDRLPLIIRFPGEQYKGRVAENVQAIDLPPTIVNYLGLAVPAWMEGTSLIPPVRINKFRAILSTHSGEWGSLVQGWRQVAKYDPPFYSMGGIAVVVCNRWYQLKLEDGGLFVRDVEGHTRPCTEQELPTPQAALQFMLSHLEKKGYDVSSVPVVRRNAP